LRVIAGKEGQIWKNSDAKGLFLNKKLRIAADIINASVRNMDIVARYGGDEFCVILRDASRKESWAKRFIP